MKLHAPGGTRLTRLESLLTIVGISVFGLVLWLAFSDPVKSQRDDGYGVSYYLVNWEVVEPVDGPAYWAVPERYESVGVFDMRSIPNQALSADQFDNICCALIASPIRNIPDSPASLKLSDSLNLQVVDPDSASLRLGFRSIIPNVPDEPLSRWLREVVLLHGDPTGQTAVKPLLPDRNLTFSLNIGPVRAFTDRISDVDAPEWDRVLEVFRNDYDLQKSINDGSETHLRLAGYWRDKYGFDVRSPEQQQDGIRDPETVLNEDFDGADKADCGYDLTWSEYLNLSQNFNNACYNTDGGATPDLARADSDLSGTDMLVTSDVLNANINNTFSGSTGRNTSTATVDAYVCVIFRIPGGNDFLRIGKFVGGSFTGLGDSPPTELSAIAGVTTLDIQGSNQQCDWASTSGGFTESLSASDTAISSGVRCGVIMGGNGIGRGSVNTWQCEDVAAVTSEVWTFVQ